MPVPNQSTMRLRAAVSVTSMARAIGLSRSRFYDYIKRGVFPQPLYSTATRRPFYNVEQQQEVIAARQTGIGSNGEYVLFYERQAAVKPPEGRAAARGPHADLVEGLKALGLTVTPQKVAEAVATSFPGGIENVDEAVVLRTVYRLLRRSSGG